MIKKSFCHLCLAECGIVCTVENNRLTKISPNFDDPISRGYICEKSQRLIEFQYSTDRIQSPLKRVAGTLVPISWQQAISEIVVQLGDCPLYMAPLSPTYNANTIYSFELMAKLGVKYATNVFSFEKAYTLLTHREFFNSVITPNREECDSLIIIGQNPWITQHYPRARTILNKIKHDTTRRLIVIDPIRSETATMADVHIQIVAGTDAWLLSALIKSLIDDKIIDREFIDAHTTNFNQIIKHFNNIDLAECLEICQVSSEQVALLVSAFKQGSVAIDYGNGICHSLLPFTNNYLIVLLHLITGNYWDSTATKLSSGLLTAIDHYHREKLTPTTKQRQLNGILAAPLLSNNLEFSGIIVDNSNPALRAPNSDKFKEKLIQNNMVVVLDSFMSATAKLANYVLPTLTFLERYECVNSVHSENGTLQLSKPLLTAEFAKSSNEIFELMIAEMSNLDTAEELTIEQLLELYYQRKPVVYQYLRKTIGKRYQNPILAVVWWQLFLFNINNNDTATAISITDKQIEQLDQTSIVQINTKLEPVPQINLTPSFLTAALKLSKNKLTNIEYKFVLQCGYRQKTSMNEVIGSLNEPILEISIVDAESLNIVDNETIILQTELTSIEIKCKLVSNTNVGLIRIANHPIINQLVPDNNVDYLSPQHKYVAANIRKI